MHLELQDGLVALTLILAVATMLAIAPALRVPYPILLVLGGLAIGVVPGMPQFDLDPELVFFGVLPPLLYSAAFFTSLRELRSNVRPIGLLALGLVLATTVGVAVSSVTLALCSVAWLLVPLVTSVGRMSKKVVLGAESESTVDGVAPTSCATS